MTSEAKLATEILKKNNIGVDLIDLNTIKPLDTKTIIKSVKKTGNLIIIDSGFNFLSIASEIISILSTNSLKYFKSEPIKLTMPDIPVPSSFSLTKKIYPGYLDIIKAAERIFKKKLKFNKIQKACTIFQISILPTFLILFFVYVAEFSIFNFVFIIF